MTRSEFLRLMARATAALATSQIVPTASAQPAKMQTRPIPSTGEALPVVGSGTWRTFDVGQDAGQRASLREVLQILFDAGGSVIDTAPMYGSAEANVGDLLQDMQARGKVFVATKVLSTGREAGIGQMRRSMELLRTDRVDLMQIHNLLDWRTQLATLRAWKKEGRIRYLGITHYTPGAHDELQSVMRAERVDFVQVDYSLNDRAAEQRLLPLAAERGMAVVVNRPFGSGDLFQTLRGKPLPAWAAEIDCQSWAQLLLKFVLANPAVTCVIPGTGRPEHMRENVRAGFGRYPDAAMRAKMIAALSS